MIIERVDKIIGELKLSIKISLNSLYWPGSDPRLVENHKTVTSHFGLKVNYHEEKINHGVWIDRVLKTSDADVVGFFDIDCIPLQKSSTLNLIKFVAKNKSIAGAAQASNHIPPMTHVYVAPCAFFIWRKLWVELGEPSFSETTKSDVGENVNYIAEANGVRMQALYPTKFESEPEEGVWRLNNYGFFGIGTVFGDDQFYHLYQSRMDNNIELFAKRCNEVINGTFDSSSFYKSTDFSYSGKVCNYPQEQSLYTNLFNKL